MRTTLNIADDVLLAAKDRARREKRSTGEVLSDLARHALVLADKDGASSAAFDGFIPLPPRGKTVSNELINRLRHRAKG